VLEFENFCRNLVTSGHRRRIPAVLCQISAILVENLSNLVILAEIGLERLEMTRNLLEWQDLSQLEGFGQDDQLLANWPGFGRIMPDFGLLSLNPTQIVRFRTLLPESVCSKYKKYFYIILL
jgi:hypothetical protein